MVKTNTKMPLTETESAGIICKKDTDKYWDSQ